MAADLIVRFLIGGAVVSAFALLGDVFKPKTFAGLFGAAPSIALASLALTVSKQSAKYGAVEARSMLLGAVAFLIYSNCVCRKMLSGKSSATPVTLWFLLLWLGAALALYLAARWIWA